MSREIFPRFAKAPKPTVPSTPSGSTKPTSPPMLRKPIFEAAIAFCDATMQDKKTARPTSSFCIAPSTLRYAFATASCGIRTMDTPLARTDADRKMCTESGRQILRLSGRRLASSGSAATYAAPPGAAVDSSADDRPGCRLYGARTHEIRRLDGCMDLALVVRMRHCRWTFRARPARARPGCRAGAGLVLPLPLPRKQNRERRAL